MSAKSASAMIATWISDGMIGQGTLSAKKLQPMLRSAGYLQGGTKEGWSPTQKGRQIGVALEKREDEGGEYSLPVYSQQAMEAILKMYLDGELDEPESEPETMKADVNQGIRIDDDLYKEFKVALLAKSVKYSGFCVAGIDLETGTWIRLMAPDEDGDNRHGSLLDEHLICQDNHVAEPLDVVRFTGCSAPDWYQTENTLVDFSTPLVYEKHIELRELLTSHPESLSGRKKLFYTNGATCPKTLGDKLDYSLLLAHVQNLSIYSRTDPSGKTRVLADFDYQSRFNNREPVHCAEFRVTVPELHRREDINIHRDDAYLTLSIGMPFNDNIYKYVAHVF